jgi:tetratricopeptide (TPR) repeat protein
MKALSSLLAVGLVLAGCAHAVPVPSARSTEGWSEYDTPHFSIDTDLSPAEAQKAARALEQLRQTLVTVAWPNFSFPAVARSRVVILADGLEFQRLFGRQIGALVNRNGIESRVVLWGKPDHWRQRKTLAFDSSTSTLQHELAHDLAAFVYLRQPRWFAEGLAQYLATAELKEDGNVEVGQIDLYALSTYHKHRTVTVQDIIDWSGPNDAHSEGVTHGLYGLSWLMVHYLLNTYPREFSEFQLALSKGTKPREAWLELASKLPSNLDAELQAYSVHGNYTVVHRPLVPMPDAPIAEKALAPADVHAIRSMLASIAVGTSSEDRDVHRAEAKAELAEALAEDPTNVRAAAIAPRRGHAPEVLALAERVAQIHPEDPLAWYLLGRAAYLSKDPERAEVALRKAIELDPSMADAFNELAWVLVKASRFPEALPLATEAVHLAPWNSALLDTLASALNGLGRCPEALVLEERAVDLLPERASAASSKPYLDARAMLRNACGDQKATSNGPDVFTRRLSAAL